MIHFDFMQKIQRLSSLERSYLKYYPDTIPYNYDQETYLAKMADLAADEGQPYFYVNHYGIKKVGRARYAWEWLRGKLGFENRCESTRVQMALQKFFYYGYVNDYAYDQIKELASMHLTRGVRQFSQVNETFYNTLLNNPSPNDISLGQLQHSMLGYYRKYASALQPSFWRSLFSSKPKNIPNLNDAFFVFGDSMMGLMELGGEDNQNLLHATLLLKPHGEDFVFRYQNRVINSIYVDSAATIIPKNCLMGRAIAAYYMDKAENELTYYGVAKAPIIKLVMTNRLNWSGWSTYATVAAHLDPEIVAKHLPRFAQCALYNKNYKEAARLMAEIKDVETQFNLVTADTQHEKALRSYLKKDTDLAKKLAEKYLAQAQSSFTWDSKSYFDSAESLASWRINPNYYFLQYVKYEKLDKAYEVFDQVTDKEVLDVDSRKKLAQLFSEQGEKQYSEGSNQIGQKSEGIELYKNSLFYKKRAHQLVPDNEQYAHDVNIHRRLLSQNLFQLLPSNEQTSKYEFENYRIERLEKIIKRYRKCYDQGAMRYDGYLACNFIPALEKRASIAIEQCLERTPDPNNHGFVASQEHKKQCMPHLTKVQECLELAIEIAAQGKDQTLLAKFHFMLGDLQRYFTIEGCLEHLRQAAQLAPQNPFYAASYAQEANNDELLKQAWKLFDKNDLNRLTYFDWKEERWNLNKIKSTAAQNIHDYQPQSNVIVSSVKRLIGL